MRPGPGAFIANSVSISDQGKDTTMGVHGECVYEPIEQRGKCHESFLGVNHGLGEHCDAAAAAVVTFEYYI